MAMENKVNAPLLLTIVVASALLLLITVIGVDAWYKSEERAEVAAKWDESPNLWLRDLRTAQQQNLKDGHRINRSHYRLEISDAMRIVAQRGGK